MSKSKKRRQKKSGKASRRRHDPHADKKGSMLSMRSGLKNVVKKADKKATSPGGSFVTYLIAAILLGMVVWMLVR